MITVSARSSGIMTIFSFSALRLGNYDVAPLGNINEPQSAAQCRTARYQWTTHNWRGLRTLNKYNHNWKEQIETKTTSEKIMEDLFQAPMFIWLTEYKDATMFSPLRLMVFVWEYSSMYGYYYIKLQGVFCPDLQDLVVHNILIMHP